MNLVEPYLKLPIRLRRAVWVWAALGLVVSALPAGASESLGMAANAGFWGLLSLLCLAPYWSALVSASPVQPTRRRANRTQARRRTLSRTGRVLLAA